MITEISRYSSELKKNFYFVRHAQSEANVLLTGGGDSNLTNLGIQQAKDAGIELRTCFNSTRVLPKALIHTGFNRTIQTLQEISGVLETNIKHDEMSEFRERELGTYEGKGLNEILLAPELKGLFEKFGQSCVWFLESKEQGVEPLLTMFNRILGVIKSLQVMYGDAPVVAVGHAGSMKVVRKIYEDGNSDNLANYLSGFVPKNCEVYKLG